MAQYVNITGSSFGGGHDDNPTYALSLPASRPYGGTPFPTGIALNDGAGNYNQPATGITKAELTAGIAVEFEDNYITSSIITVESGFQCTGESIEVAWTDDYEDGIFYGEAYVTMSLVSTATNTSVTYRVTVNLDGYDPNTFDVTSTGTIAYTTKKLTRDAGTVDGTGTVTVTRLSDSSGADTTADEGYTITAGAYAPASDFNTSNGTDSGTAGDTPSLNASITNWERDDIVTIFIEEGTA